MNSLQYINYDHNPNFFRVKSLYFMINNSLITSFTLTQKLIYLFNSFSHIEELTLSREFHANQEIDPGVEDQCLVFPELQYLIHSLKNLKKLHLKNVIPPKNGNLNLLNIEDFLISYPETNSYVYSHLNIYAARLRIAYISMFPKEQVNIMLPPFQTSNLQYLTIDNIVCGNINEDQNSLITQERNLTTVLNSHPNLRSISFVGVLSNVFITHVLFPSLKNKIKNNANRECPLKLILLPTMIGNNTQKLELYELVNKIEQCFPSITIKFTNFERI